MIKPDFLKKNATRILQRLILIRTKYQLYVLLNFQNIVSFLDYYLITEVKRWTYAKFKYDQGSVLLI